MPIVPGKSILDQIPDADPSGPVVPGAAAATPGRDASAMPVPTKDVMDSISSTVAQQEQQQAFGAVNIAAQNRNPDQYARALKLSKASGLGMDVVQRNLDLVENKVKVREAVGALNPDAPALISWLGQPDNASVAHDDLPNLQQVEQTVQDHSLLTEVGHAITSGIYKTDAAVAKLPALLYNLAAVPGNLMAEAIGQPDREQSAPDWLLNNPLATQYDKAADFYRPPAISTDAMDQISKGDFKGASRTLTLKVAEQIPMLVGMLGLGAAGAPEAATGLMGVTGASEANAQAQASGVSPLAATTNAVAQGGIQAFASQLPLNILHNWGSEIAATYGQSVSKAIIGNVAKNVAKATMGGATDNAFISMATDYVNAGTGVNPNAMEGSGQRAIEAGLVGAIAGGLSTSLVAGISGRQQMANVQAQQDFYRAHGTDVEASLLKARLPEKMQEYINHVTNGTGVDTVHLDPQAAEAYFQSKKMDVVQVMNDLGATKSLDEAKATGGSIEIPLGNWSSKMAGTEHYDGLADHIKFSEADMTPAQAKAASERAADEWHSVMETKRQADQSRAQAQVDVATADQAAAAAPENLTGSQVEDLVHPQIKAFEQRFKELGFKGDPAVLMNGIAKMYASQGISPDEGLTDLNLRLDRAATPDAAGLNQVGLDMSPEARKARAEALGFDTSRVIMHGGTAGIEEFRTNPKGANKYLDGVYMTPSANEADRYAGMARTGGGQSEIYKFYAPKDLLSLDDVASADAAITKMGLDVPKYKPKFKYNPEMDSLSKMRKAVKEALQKEGLRAGEKAVDRSLRDRLTEAGYKGLKTENDLVHVVFDPKDVRSVDAEFKPGESANILFQGGQDPKGQFVLDQQGVRIDLLPKADQSTPLHEIGHLYLHVLDNLANREGATDQIREDLGKLKDWFGIARDAKIERAQHEQFAEGFEAYLQEGKAPTKALQSAFENFKTWLINVYNGKIKLGIPLTDDVREIMSRLVAGNDSVEQAARGMNYGPLFGDPASVGMTEAQALKYRRAQSDTEEVGKALVQKKLMRELTRKQSKEYEEQRKEVYARVEAQVDGTQHYQALANLETGKLPNGEPLPAGQEALKIDPDYLDKETRKGLPRKIFEKDTGEHPEIVAGKLGFADAADMFETLKKIPPRDALISQNVEREMAARFPSLVNTPELSQTAIEAVHNERRADVVNMELEHIAREHPNILKDNLGRAIARLPSNSDVRAAAEDMIGKRATEDIKPIQYQRLEIKSSKEAAAAAKKGDWDAAFQAKSRERANAEAYRAAINAVDHVESKISDYRKLFRKDEDLAKTRDMNLVNAGRAILAQFELAPKSGKSAAEYLDTLKTYDPVRYNGIKTLVDSAVPEGSAGNYRQVPFETFSEMTRAVDAIWNLARESKQIEINGKKVNQADLVQRLSDRAALFSKESRNPGWERDLTPADKASLKFSSLKATVTRVEHWTLALGGEFHEAVFQPVQDGVTAYHEAKIPVVNELRSIFEDSKEIFTRDKIRSPELRYEFRDKTTLLGALLHRGNDSNFSKLLRGRGWGEQRSDGTLDTSRWDAFEKRMQDTGVLTKADYDFVQRIWKLNESLKPEAQAAHQAVLGYRFNEITAKPFTNRFGAYEGGYVPARLDPLLDGAAEVRAEIAKFEEMNPSFQFPTTGRGFGKNRIDSYAGPLSLELSNIGLHIDGVLKFSHIEPRVREVFRLVTNSNFKEAVGAINPKSVKDMLIPWLNVAASQNVVTGSNNAAFDSFAAFMRRSYAIQVMTMNVKNALQQQTGHFVAMSKVAPGYWAESLASYTKSPREQNAFMTEKSDFMRVKQDHTSRESMEFIRNIVTDAGILDRTQQLAGKHAYFLSMMSQNSVNSVVWNAAFRQAMDVHGDEARAVRDADSVIRTTQHNDAPESLSRLQTGTQLQRLFTQFTSYFDNINNLAASEGTRLTRELGMKKATPQLLALMATTFAIPAILTDVIGRSLGSKFKADDETQKDLGLDLFFGSLFREATGRVPFVGPTVNAGVNRIRHKSFDDRLSLSPVVSYLDQAATVPSEVWDTFQNKQFKNKKAMTDILTMVGTLTKLPLGTLAKPLGYVHEVQAGNARPTGPIDYTRGLVTGRK